MSEEHKIEKFIEREIAKSGFPLEQMCSITLSKHGWSVEPHIIFYDEEGRKYAESDIRAYRANKMVEKGYDVLVMECKKQEYKPWVFFEQDEPNHDVCSLNVAILHDYSWIGDAFEKHYYYGKTPCSYHFPMFGKPALLESMNKKAVQAERLGDKEKRSEKKGKETDNVFEAINQVLSALTYFMSIENTYVTERLSKRKLLFYPVIVVDGRIFSARISGEGRVTITERNYLQLRQATGLATPEYVVTREPNTKALVKTIKHYIIDIVKKEYFEEFLKNFQ